MVTSSSPVRQIFSANQSRKGRKNPEPGTEVPGKEATETKSPLGDGTTNLMVPPQFQSQNPCFFANNLNSFAKSIRRCGRCGTDDAGQTN